MMCGSTSGFWNTPCKVAPHSRAPASRAITTRGRRTDQTICRSPLHGGRWTGWPTALRQRVLAETERGDRDRQRRQRQLPAPARAESCGHLASTPRGKTLIIHGFTVHINALVARRIEFSPSTARPAPGPPASVTRLWHTPASAHAVMFHRIDRLPLRVVLYLFDHLRITVRTKITGFHSSTCSSDTAGAFYAGGRRSAPRRAPSSARCLPAPGIQIGVGHVHPHPLVRWNIGHRRIGLLARLEGVVNQRLGLGLALDHLADKADPPSARRYRPALRQPWWGSFYFSRRHHGAARWPPPGSRPVGSARSSPAAQLATKPPADAAPTGFQYTVRSPGVASADLGHKAGELRPELFCQLLKTPTISSAACSCTSRLSV